MSGETTARKQACLRPTGSVVTVARASGSATLDQSAAACATITEPPLIGTFTLRDTTDSELAPRAHTGGALSDRGITVKGQLLAYPVWKGDTMVVSQASRRSDP